MQGFLPYLVEVDKTPKDEAVADWVVLDTMAAVFGTCFWSGRRAFNGAVPQGSTRARSITACLPTPLENLLTT